MAKSTFGVKLEIWDAGLSTPAFVEVKELLSLTPPSKEADTPVDTTNHNSASGVREVVAAGTFKWTASTGQCNDEPTDAGQILVAAAVGVDNSCFRVTKASNSSNPVIFYGIVTKFDDDAQPLNGNSTKTLEIQPSGNTNTSP